MNVTIKLHKETKLLFLKGGEADIQIVAAIIAELGGKPLPQDGKGRGKQDDGGGSKGGGGAF